LNLVYTTQFKKDFKRISNQGKDISKLEVVIDILMSGKLLVPQYKDHALVGKWKDHRDCH